MRTLFSICLLLIASSASSLPADGQDLASFASKAKPIVEAKNPNWKPAGREKLIGKEHKDTFFMAGEVEKAASALSSSTVLPSKRRPIGCNSL